MRLLTYIYNKKSLIIFYIILMLFITSVISLSPNVKLSINNILYLNSVSLVFFLIYLSIQFLKFNSYCKKMKKAIETQYENILIAMPEPTNFEQSQYTQLVKKLYDIQKSQIEVLYEDKIDNSEFVTSWVHEIKTPIAVSRLIIENSFDKPKEDILDSLEEELDKIDNYVEQALYYSRVDSFSKDYFINEISISKVINELVKKHAKTFISKRIKIDIKNTDFNVLSDKKWLIFIIDQVLSNSLKYSDSESSIKIYGEKTSSGHKLTIEDSGIGIPAEDLHRVFEKGFTGRTGRKNSKSTGMGLYLAKTLSKKLGHDISIESELEEYTKVTIHFPKLTNYFNQDN